MADQPYPCECPLYVTALLEHIRSQMEVCFWNKFQKEMHENYGDPFSNSGNVRGFKNQVFEVHAYDWNWDFSDSDDPQPFNFKCGDIEICWYKYLGRGMEINKEKVTPDEMVAMYDKCMASLDGDWNNELGGEED